APSMTSQRFVPISGAWCRRQGGHSYRPLVLPEEDRAYAPRLVGIAWLFPGQGSQSVGMGKELAARYPTAARVFEEANDALGFDLRALCFDGPKEELDRTANTQPALLATSLAALRAAQEAGAIGEPAIVLGHSLGEFTAIVAASALTLADALGLVRTRGELMQAADSNGGMAAVLGLDADVVARTIVGTAVVVANVDAKVHEHARELPALLEKQVWSPVQWVASVRRAEGDGASVFVEFGPGNVLTGLVKRILPDSKTGNVADETTLRQSLPLLEE